MKKAGLSSGPFRINRLGNYCPSLLFMAANFAWSFVFA